jgi:predicted RNA-binding Zn-ribbon protein involved in translation (DUF1610 family)
MPPLYTMTKKAKSKMPLRNCLFCERKLRPVGIDRSHAFECPKCHHVFVIEPHQEGAFAKWTITIYENTLATASEQPQQFQTSMF